MFKHARSATIVLGLLVAAGCARKPEAAADQGSPPVAMASAAAADASSPRVAPRGFANSPDRGELATYVPGAVRRDGAYTWHRTDLSEAHALRAMADGHLRVATPAGRMLDVRYDRHVEHGSGDWTWIGHVEGHPEQQTILTFGADAAFGTIAQPDGLPLRLTVRDRASWMVETDASKIALIRNAATRPGRPDYKVPPKLTGFSDAPGAPSMAGAQAAPAAVASAATVDLVLGYTPAFASENGGTSAAVTRLNFLVDVTNVAYRNSGIDASVRLVATVPVTYTDASSNDDVLEKLTGYNSTSNTKTTPDPAFNALRAARETYGADLVSMVRSYRDPENGGCGIAWLIGGGQSGIATSDSYFGYSVVSDGTDQGTDGKTYYCLDETLAHELGHNMGAAHDVATSKGDDGVLDAEDYGAFSYSFGYKTTSTTGNFYTVMAYGDSGQHLYRIFSNPRSTFCGGRACGTTTQADNARTLTQTIPTVATFRSTVVPLETLAIHDDINGDAKADLLFHNAAAKQFSYRLMDGTSTKNSSLIGGVGTGYWIAATGDFDGDGHADLAWTNSARHVYLWLGNGSGFSSRQTDDYASGWVISGAGDVDGDGRDDLIFHNASTRQFTYWVMSGATVLGTRSIGGVGAGYRVAATGDFNGDGKLDVVWTSSALDLYLWLGNGSTFTSAKIGTYPAGWAVAGAGDVDGDGQADLLFHNASAAKFSYRIMHGTTTVRSALLSVGAGYHVAATGDYNGDGRDDLVWTSSARDLYMWLGNGTGFASTRVGTYPSGWVVVR
jgi:hypothetical protein